MTLLLVLAAAAHADCNLAPSPVTCEPASAPICTRIGSSWNCDFGQGGAGDAQVTIAYGPANSGIGSDACDGYCAWGTTGNGDAFCCETTDVVGGGVELTNMTVDFGTGNDDLALGVSGGSFLDADANGATSIFSLTVNLGAGDDLLDGIEGDVRTAIDAGAGADVIFTGFEWDYVYGGAGADEIHGGDGNDTLVGGDGADACYGDGDNDTLSGEIGNDRLEGGAGPDILYGGDGADTLLGGTGPDRLYGDAGNDRISGNDDKDKLWGGAGADTLCGQAAVDTIHGDGGNDALDGGAGADRLNGGGGTNDTCEDPGALGCEGPLGPITCPS